MIIFNMSSTTAEIELAVVLVLRHHISEAQG